MQVHHDEGRAHDVQPEELLEQHRPLGNINRMRLAVYLASLQVRQKLYLVAS